jgi:CubicO group peptidase (beta-lactamase class C family)
MSRSVTSRLVTTVVLTSWLGSSILVHPPVVQGQHTPFEAAIARFEARLAADTASDSIGSIVAGVVVGDRTVWQGAFGWADTGAGRPARPDGIYRTGSISKSFTALILVLLAAEGTVALDDPVERYLPEVRGLVQTPPGSPPITLRQLASHTAGLIREPRLPGAASGPLEDWEEKILAAIPTTAFQSPPGEGYAYSNIGFGILGLALSRAAGRPFMDLVTERIFQPLGMSSSTFQVDGQLQDRLATGYANRRDGSVDAEQPLVEHAGRGYKVPNGGIYSTVEDLGHFIAALSGARSLQGLDDTGRAEMMRVQTPEDPTGGYGLGLTITVDLPGRRRVAHGGSVAGYTAHLVFDPDRQIGVILLRNYGSGRTNLGQVAAQLLSELVRSGI